MLTLCYLPVLPNLFHSEMHITSLHGNKSAIRRRTFCPDNWPWLTRQLSHCLVWVEVSWTNLFRQWQMSINKTKEQHSWIQRNHLGLQPTYKQDPTDTFNSHSEWTLKTRTFWSALGCEVYIKSSPMIDPPNSTTHLCSAAIAPQAFCGPLSNEVHCCICPDFGNSCQLRRQVSNREPQDSWLRFCPLSVWMRWTVGLCPSVSPSVYAVNIQCVVQQMQNKSATSWIT